MLCHKSGDLEPWGTRRILAPTVNSRTCIFPSEMAASKINAVDKLTITFLVDNSIEWFVLVTVVARSRSKQSACR